MKSTVEDQERTDQSAAGAESGAVAMGEKVVIQTALVLVGYNDKFYEMRPLFDTGSTRTYITKELAKMLKVKPVEQQTFSAYLFGSTKGKEKTSPAVDLAIKIKAGKTIIIKATVTLQITGPLKWVPVQLENQRKIQKNFSLADTLPKDIDTYTLGLLIGNDYYHDIILDKRKKIQDNLYVINSKFGWMS